jgi:hypothetical protein
MPHLSAFWLEGDWMDPPDGLRPPFRGDDGNWLYDQHGQ